MRRLLLAVCLLAALTATWQEPAGKTHLAADSVQLHELKVVSPVDGSARFPRLRANNPLLYDRVGGFCQLRSR